jgi:hypothetical protein
MPSGLLVTHEMTRQVIALGASPLSSLLVSLFTKDFEMPVYEKFYPKMRKSKAYDLKSFEELAPLWFEKAKLKFVKIIVHPPLSSFIPVAADLSVAYNKVPFEKIQIVAGVAR